jgi:hypothetical protein
LRSSPITPGQAKAAREAAADLRRHAQGDPLVVRHQHRADPAPAVQHVDQLAAPVRRRHLALELGHLDHGPLGERLAEVLRQVAHGLQIEDRLAIHPGRELAAAIARRAELDGEVLELGRQ